MQRVFTEWERLKRAAKGQNHDAAQVRVKNEKSTKRKSQWKRTEKKKEGFRRIVKKKK